MKYLKTLNFSISRKRLLEENELDNIDCRKTEIKEEKARIYMTGGERVWNTDLKSDSITLKHTFIGKESYFSVY